MKKLSWMLIVALIVSLFAFTAVAEDAVTPVEIWPEGNVPYEYDPVNAPTTVTQFELWGSTMDVPTESYAPYMMAYTVENPIYSVVLMPGGGYFHMNSLELEGSAIAAKFNEAGISCFVVAYRIGPNDYRGILADGQRAMRYVRYHAADYGIDPDKIAMMGFSQGGHLSIMTAEHTEFAIDDPDYVPDEIDSVSCAPNALILGYPVVTLEEGVTFEPGALIFCNGNQELREKYSGENAVTADLGPVFIWLCADDDLVPPENSYRLAQACAEAGVEYELHVFQEGGHGIGLAEGQDCSIWMNLAIDFVERLAAESAAE